MPTRSGYTGSKKKKATKKSTSQKGSKSGSKSGGGGSNPGGGGSIPSGGGGTDGLASQDPIIIAGGGSVTLTFNRGQFISSSVNNRNAAATLSHIIVNGVRTNLGPLSRIEIHFL